MLTCFTSSPSWLIIKSLCLPAVLTSFLQNLSLFWHNKSSLWLMTVFMENTFSKFSGFDAISNTSSILSSKLTIVLTFCSLFECSWYRPSFLRWLITSATVFNLPWINSKEMSNSCNSNDHVSNLVMFIPPLKKFFKGFCSSYVKGELLYRFVDSVTSTVFESKDKPTQMTKQSLTIIDFITYRKSIHFELICKDVHN